MKTGRSMKFVLGLLLILVIMFSIILILNKDEKKTVLTDFSEINPINAISTTSGKSSFDLTITKGNYRIGDCVYVLRKGTTSLYSKYEIDETDVATLKSKDLNLFLSFSGNVNSFIMEYVVVKKADVSQFETLFNVKDANGELATLFQKPMIKRVFGTGALTDLKIVENEYDADNEKIHIDIMQSQLYAQNVIIKVVNFKDEVFLEKTLTTDDLNQLKRDNLVIEFSAIHLVNEAQKSQKNSDLFVKIYNGDETPKQAFHFQIKVE
jgi:hypothetical protein